MGSLPQFYWLWAPLNFPDYATFFHTNDDGEGAPWNRRAVIDAIGRSVTDYDRPEYEICYRPGTRRVETLTVDLAPDAKLLIEPTGLDFHMSGLGYTHPQWGHGMDHGESEGGGETAYDRIEPGEADPHQQLYLHIQAFSRATLTLGGAEHRGHGILEQLLIGPHAPSGFTGLLDGAQ
jgi:hypothetical protein